LAFPSFDPSHIEPWVSVSQSPSDDRPPAEVARELAAERRKVLETWSVTEAELATFADSIAVRVVAPGSPSGELLHVLSSLERRSDRWDDDPDAARGALSAAVSLLLRLPGRDHDPAKSREHVLLSVLAERRLVAGQVADLGALLEDLDEPPLDRIGALDLDDFMSKRDRRELAAALNTLLAAPSFASWRQGISLDVGEWMEPNPERTPVTIVSVAHLDDEERTLVLGVLLEEVMSWVRSLPGSQRLRGLVVFDEVYGFLPPHPANPPTKRPLVALMKQGRGFGVGVVVATQNPMDLDYRALSNAGLWFMGRLQIDADRERVIDGLAVSQSAGQAKSAEGFKARLAQTIGRLAPRWFVVRSTYLTDGAVLLTPRWAMSFLRGPMSGSEIRKARGVRAEQLGEKSAGDQGSAEQHYACGRSLGRFRRRWRR
jgi:hypothetical protein